MDNLLNNTGDFLPILDNIKINRKLDHEKRIVD